MIFTEIYVSPLDRLTYLWYNIDMKKEYIETANAVSYIRYHFIFCTYRLRKIFDIPGLEDRFKELVGEICDELEVEIVELDFHGDHVHLLLSVLPSLSITELVATIRKRTSADLRKEFTELGSTLAVWKRNFFVSTEEVLTDSTIRSYVRSQKSKKKK